MDINEEVLITLGFVQDFRRKDVYRYKGVIGNYRKKTNMFFFQGFTPAIGTVTDLKYLLMLIDYRQESSFVGYPSSEN